MMAAFNVTLLGELGYNMSTTLGLANPRDPRFAAQDYTADAFTPEAVRRTLESLADLHAYPHVRPSSTESSQGSIASIAATSSSNGLASSGARSRSNGLVAVIPVSVQ